MRYINSSNYENDEREYLSGFLNYITEDKQKKECTIDTIIQIILYIILMMMFHFFLKILYQDCLYQNLELNSLYNLGGYLLNSIKKTCKICDACLQSAVSKNELKYSFIKFVQLKYYKKFFIFY